MGDRKGMGKMREFARKRRGGVKTRESSDPSPFPPSVPPPLPPTYIYRPCSPHRPK